MFYLVRTPAWLRSLYPSLLWRVDTRAKELYLTFDDGPHPRATRFALDTLKSFGARASFFCIGKNVLEHPELFARIREEGHTIGNHSHNHLNGWKTRPAAYIENICRAQACIPSQLFRPPYGRITRAQASLLQREKGFRVVMWDVLSGDFDPGITADQVFRNVARYAREGSIIVFHDSEKAWGRMSYALPRTLEYFSSKGFVFKTL